MSTSQIGTVLDAIRAALILRDNLSGVNVYSGPVMGEEVGEECIMFGDARLVDDRAAMGGVKEGDWEVDGLVVVYSRTWAGSTEATIKATRDRALALFAEVESHINDTYVGALPDVEVTAGELDQAVGAEGRYCGLTFTVTVFEQKTP